MIEIKCIVRGIVRSRRKGTWGITEKEAGVKDESVLTGGRNPGSEGERWAMGGSGLESISGEQRGGSVSDGTTGRSRTAAG